MRNTVRDLENTKIPVIMFSYSKNGGCTYEDINTDTERNIARNSGFGFAVG
jgi:hypothetical protein